MAGNFNKVILLGNLTRDIELRPAGGTSVGKVGLAVNRRFTTAGGEAREEVTFIDCEAWGKQAETMAKYLSKGKSVMIEGRLKLDQWEDKEGKKQSKLKVVVEGFQFVDSKGAGGGGGGESGGGAGASRPPARGEPASAANDYEPVPPDAYSDINDKDIPF